MRPPTGPPRLAPLGWFAYFSALNTDELGGWARPKLERAIAGTAGLEDRHLLDQIGHVLALREHRP